MASKKHAATSFDRARDELFSHIHRCEVISATEEQQVEWMDDTIEFMAERYPDLSKQELTDLRSLGLRFCKPVIPHGTHHTAASDEEANAA